jgi:hypothetical protein
MLGHSLFPPESPAISKRKPPSQRPERKLDDTARAIARAREDTPAEKPAGSLRPSHTSQLTSPTGRDTKTSARQATGGPPPSPSTKRPKHPS